MEKSVPLHLLELIENHIEKISSTCPRVDKTRLFPGCKCQTKRFLPFYFIDLNKKKMSINNEVIPHAKEMRRIGTLARFRLSSPVLRPQLTYAKQLKHNLCPDNYNKKLARFPRRSVQCLVSYDGHLVIEKTRDTGYGMKDLFFSGPLAADIQYIARSAYLDFPPQFNWLPNHNAIQPRFIRLNPYL